MKVENKKHKPKHDKDADLNLCDTCEHDYPICNGKQVRFGTGKGNDNIIKCNTYK